MSFAGRAPSVEADVVLVGCGDLGTRIGLGLSEIGLDVVGLRRSAHLVPTPIRGVAVDLTGSAPLPELTADLVVVCLTADGRDAEAYRRTYLDGMTRALEAFTATPREGVLVSSTSVYGDREGELDEATPPEPRRETATVLLEAEQAFATRVPRGVVARLSGLYGPGRAGRMIEQVRRGENPDPGRWTNRIHESDAAAAVVHLLTTPRGQPSTPIPSQPAETFLVTDDHPTPSGDVRAFVAARLGVPWTSTATEPHGRRLSNARLRRTGFDLEFPSYREGYASMLD